MSNDDSSPGYCRAKALGHAAVAVGYVDLGEERAARAHARSAAAWYRRMKAAEFAARTKTFRQLMRETDDSYL